MKFNNIKKQALLLLSVIIVAAVCISSCTEQRGNDVASGDIVQNITNNTIEITGNDKNDVTYATASGLRSAVSIYCTFETTTGGNSYWNPRPTTQTYYTTGSGVIYKTEEDGSAFVITNHHVVYDSDSDTENGISNQIYIYLYGLEVEAYAIAAEYVGGSSNYDIAILRIDKSEVLKTAYSNGSVAGITFADSDKINAGDTVLAIGNPSASSLSGISVTSGIVSVDSEYITMTGVTGTGNVTFRVIRTDTPINSGNSGGGLFNDSGELVGIVNAKITSSTIENIGYALPSNVVRAIADNIIDYCYEKENENVMRCMLGITLEIVDYSTAYNSETGLFERKETVGISEVTADSLGSTVLKAGDVVKSITVDGKTTEITRQHHLIDSMLDARVGDSVSFTIIRDGEEKTVSITITESCLTAY